MIDLANRLIEKYNSVHNWLREKDKYGWQRSAKIITGALVLIAILQLICPWKQLMFIVILSFVVLVVDMLLFFLFDTKDDHISKIKRGHYNTPRELLREMNHCSYLYGLLFIVFEITIYVTIFLGILGMIFGRGGSYFDISIFLYLWIFGMFIYTFFYFAYHMRHLDEAKTIQKIKLTLQLYAAIGASISFGMILIGDNFLIKVFVVGTVLEYKWLQYFIAKENDI